MARRIISGNLVASATTGTFEDTGQGFSVDTNFVYARATTDPYEGTYHGKFSTNTSPSTAVFRNFTAASSPQPSKNYIITCYVKSNGASKVIGDTDEIKLDIQGGETINSRTQVTGLNLSSTTYTKLELDVTTSTSPSTLFITLALDDGAGGSATLNAATDLYVDSITCFQYESVDYGLFISHQFSSVINGNSYRWEIYKKDFAGSETQITSGQTPLIYNLQSNSEYEESVIESGSVMSTFIAESSLFEHEFIKANDLQYYIVVYEDVNGTYTERWRGFIIPSQYTQDFYFTPIQMNLTFTDLMADLNNIPFATDDELYLNTDIFEEAISEIELIGYCLRRLGMLDINTINVAVNYLEDSQTGTNKALAQTYINPEIFYKTKIVRGVERVESSFTLSEVIQAILLKYSARIKQWDGAYWIVDFYNDKQSSYSYQSYDLYGVELGSSSASSLIVSFGNSSSTWRFKGKQQIVGTNSYKNIDLTLSGDKEEGGLTYNFLHKNVFLLGVLGFQRFGFNSRKWQITPFIGNDNGNDPPSLALTIYPEDNIFNSSNRLYEYPNTNSTLEDDTKLLLHLRCEDTENSNTGFTISDAITYESGDSLDIEIDFYRLTGGTASQTSSFTIQVEQFPYLILKWYIKVGSYYYDYFDDSWSTSYTLNKIYIDDFGFNAKPKELYKVNLRGVSSETTEDVEIKVFIPHAAEYDLTASSNSEASMITDLKAESTSGLLEGQRYITRYLDTSSTNYYVYYWYELLPEYRVDGSEPDKVIPNDDSSKAWSLVATRAYNPSAVSWSILQDINVYFKPDDQDPNNDLTIRKTGNTQNVSTYNSELKLFDAPDEVNNSEHIYNNITFSNNTLTSPTDVWSDADSNSGKIQNHRINMLAELLKQSRQKINGSAILPVPLSILYKYQIAANDNIKYYPKNIAFDFKNEDLSAEFIEIESDNISTDVFAHETASHSAGHN